MLELFGWPKLVHSPLQCFLEDFQDPTFHQLLYVLESERCDPGVMLVALCSLAELCPERTPQNAKRSASLCLDHFPKRDGDVPITNWSTCSSSQARSLAYRFAGSRPWFLGVLLQELLQLLSFQFLAVFLLVISSASCSWHVLLFCRCS